MNNLANTFTENAVANADKTAIFWGDEQVTFGQAHRLAGGLAKRLKEEFGLQPGDRVGLWLKNCPEFVFSLFGILLAEGVVVSINNFLTPDEVGYILEDSGAKVLISEASMAEGTAVLQSQLDGLAVIEVEELGQADDSQAPELPPAGQTGEDLALIIYTSGTTGKPKGAMLSNNNLLRNIGGVMEELELTPEDRMACLLPMFHSFSMTVCVLLPMTQGLSIVAIKSLHPPKNIIVELLRHQATVLPAIPQLYRMLANAQMPPGMALRVCVSGAAPLPLEVLKAFNKNIGIPLIEGYGLSETSPVACFNPLRGEKKPGSVGLPLKGVAFQIWNDAGDVLPTGERGEICIKGHNIMIEIGRAHV